MELPPADPVAAVRVDVLDGLTLVAVINPPTSGITTIRPAPDDA